MTRTDYRNPLEDQAIRGLEELVTRAREPGGRDVIHYLTLGVTDIERLLYYIAKLEHELAYRDALAGAPDWFKE